MGAVIADISISLDGFVTGPDPSEAEGLGRGGESLHTWAIEPDDDEKQLLATATARSGAVVMGRTLFDFIDGPNGWSDEMGYGAGEAGRPPFVVVSHSRPESVRLGLDFTFVDGVAPAIERARAAAGDKDVVIMGGGDVVRQAVVGGLVDQLVLHHAPVVLGGGVPLFEAGQTAQLKVVSAVTTRSAVHVTYDA